MTRHHASQTAIRAGKTSVLPRATGAGVASADDARCGLTARQKACLEAIRAFMAASDGVAPSYAEIAQALGLRSRSGIHRIVATLIARGHITKRKNAARSLTLVEAGGAPIPAPLQAEAAARAACFDMTVQDFLAHAVRTAEPLAEAQGRRERSASHPRETLGQGR